MFEVLPTTTLFNSASSAPPCVSRIFPRLYHQFPIFISSRELRRWGVGKSFATGVL
jgi:hypothetical protein